MLIQLLGSVLPFDHSFSGVEYQKFPTYRAHH